MYGGSLADGLSNPGAKMEEIDASESRVEVTMQTPQTRWLETNKYTETQPDKGAEEKGGGGHL